jgi:predicted dehydrogenase
MTPDELLKHSEIDVIVNLTIPATHYQVTMDALSAGKHAYSEKPFVLTLEEGKSVRKAAERAQSAGRLGARHVPRRRAPAGPRSSSTPASSARSCPAPRM